MAILVSFHTWNHLVLPWDFFCVLCFISLLFCFHGQFYHVWFFGIVFRRSQIGFNIRWAIITEHYMAKYSLYMVFFFVNFLSLFLFWAGRPRKVIFCWRSCSGCIAKKKGVRAAGRFSGKPHYRTFRSVGLPPPHVRQLSASKLNISKDVIVYRLVTCGTIEEMI